MRVVDAFLKSLSNGKNDILFNLEKDGWEEQLISNPDYFYFTHRDYPGVMIKWWNGDVCEVIKL